MAWTQESRNVFIADFIRANTADSVCVVELGAGRCDKLRAVQIGCERKIAIDLHQQTLRHAVYHDCERIQGDMRSWRPLLAANRATNYDTVMIIDSLEHLTKDDGLELLGDLTKSFRKVLLMIPEGEQPQHEDASGLDNPYQSHLSTWVEADLKPFQFRTMVIPDFHGPGKGCIFAVAER
jgi:hypothetical protein